MVIPSRRKECGYGVVDGHGNQDIQEKMLNIVNGFLEMEMSIIIGKNVI